MNENDYKKIKDRLSHDERKALLLNEWIPYWEARIGEDALRGYMEGLGFEVYETENDEGSIEAMRRSYPSYIAHRYQVYNNGSCVGYVEDAVIERLLAGEEWVWRGRRLERAKG